jgi:hypothetical protein
MDYQLNTKTTCTVDEAVAMMLGLFSRDISPLVDDTNADDLNLFGKSGVFSLKEELGLWRDYYLAIAEDADLDQHGLNLELFDIEYMLKAREYLCMIEDELAKSDSELRCVNGTRNITLNSFEQWWTGKHLPSPAYKLNTAAVKELRKETNDNVLVTLGLLLGALAALVPEQLIVTPQEPTKKNQKKQEPKPFTKKNYTHIAQAVAPKFKLDNVESLNVAEFLNALLGEMGLRDEPSPQTVDTNSGRFSSAKIAASKFLKDPKNQQS